MNKDTHEKIARLLDKLERCEHLLNDDYAGETAYFDLAKDCYGWLVTVPEGSPPAVPDTSAWNGQDARRRIEAFVHHAAFQLAKETRSILTPPQEQGGLVARLDDLLLVHQVEPPDSEDCPTCSDCGEEFNGARYYSDGTFAFLCAPCAFNHLRHNAIAALTEEPANHPGIPDSSTEPNLTYGWSDYRPEPVEDAVEAGIPLAFRLRAEARAIGVCLAVGVPDEKRRETIHAEARRYIEAADLIESLQSQLKGHEGALEEVAQRCTLLPDYPDKVFTAMRKQGGGEIIVEFSGCPLFTEAIARLKAKGDA